MTPNERAALLTAQEHGPRIDRFGRRFNGKNIADEGRDRQEAAP